MSYAWHSRSLFIILLGPANGAQTRAYMLSTDKPKCIRLLSVCVKRQTNWRVFFCRFTVHIDRIGIGVDCQCCYAYKTLKNSFDRGDMVEWARHAIDSRTYNHPTPSTYGHTLTQTPAIRFEIVQTNRNYNTMSGRVCVWVLDRSLRRWGECKCYKNHEWKRLLLTFVSFVRLIVSRLNNIFVIRFRPLQSTRVRTTNILDVWICADTRQHLLRLESNRIDSLCASDTIGVFFLLFDFGIEKRTEHFCETEEVRNIQ